MEGSPFEFEKYRELFCLLKFSYSGTLNQFLNKLVLID